MQIKKVFVSSKSMQYLTFGRGDKNLVIIPGLSLQSLKGKFRLIPLLYHQFAKEYRVIIFDRRDSIGEGYSIEDMADELYQALKKLDIEYAHILGVSQGGMIAQIFAIKYSNIVNRLVLAVTLSRNNKISQKTISGWIAMAENNDIDSLNYDSVIKTFTPNYIKRYYILNKVLSKFSRKGDLNRFTILAKSILNFDCYNHLDKIPCPTLVLGAKQDQVLGVEGAREIADKVPCAIYHEFDNVGHGAYIEEKEFNKTVLHYLQTETLKK